jgi:hypothetical protein
MLQKFGQICAEKPVIKYTSHYRNSDSPINYPISATIASVSGKLTLI